MAAAGDGLSDEAVGTRMASDDGAVAIDHRHGGVRRQRLFRELLVQPVHGQTSDNDAGDGTVGPTERLCNVEVGYPGYSIHAVAADHVAVGLQGQAEILGVGTRVPRGVGQAGAGGRSGQVEAREDSIFRIRLTQLGEQGVAAAGTIGPGGDLAEGGQELMGALEDT